MDIRPLVQLMASRKNTQRPSVDQELRDLQDRLGINDPSREEEILRSAPLPSQMFRGNEMLTERGAAGNDLPWQGDMKPTRRDLDYLARYPTDAVNESFARQFGMEAVGRANAPEYFPENYVPIPYPRER